MRLQLALNVPDLDAAVRFYEKMFDTPVHKRKPGYANFAIADPPLKLVLFEQADASERLNHLGVEVFEDGEVTAITDRLAKSGVDHETEDTTCCYAESEKVWTRAPDATPWEWYRVLADADHFGEQTVLAEPDAPKRRPELSCC